MRIRFLIATTVCLLLAQSFPVRADEAMWQRALTAGEVAYRAGDYTEASYAFGIALKAAESFGESDTRLATTLGWLTETYRLQGRLAEAEPLMMRALAIRERVLGPLHPSTQLTRHNLAVLQKALRAGTPPVAAEKPVPPPKPAPVAEVKPAAPPPPPRVEEPKPQPPAPIVGLVDVKPKPPAPAPVMREEPKPQPPAPIVGVVEVKPKPPAPIIGLVDVKPKPPAPIVGRVDVKPKPPAPASAPIVESKPQPQGLKLELSELKSSPSPRPTEIVPAPPKPAPAPVPPVAAVVAKPPPAVVAKPAPAVVDRPSTPVLKPAPPPAAPSYRTAAAQQVAMLGTGVRSGAESMAPKAFELMQRARKRTEAGISRAIMRLAKGDDAVTRAAQARQDLFGKLVALDRSPAEGGDIERRIEEQDNLIERGVPSYRDHLSPALLSLAAAQALLGADEALLSYLVDEQSSYLVAVRRDRAAFLPLAIGRAELSAGVKRLRAHLDPASDLGARGQPQLFPADLANRIYTSIVAPAESILEGATHLLIVPDDALQSLPFSVLVTEPPPAQAKDAADQSRTAWLAKRFALSTLPAEGSLQALRRNPSAAAGARAFAGFGDPMLFGEDRRAMLAGSAHLFAKGETADVSAIRDFARIPETRYVLDAMADILNGDPRDVHVEADASESSVKRAALADYRVLAFATYGLMAGEFPGAAEPALVLTPPRAASVQDDGLLTASEITQLKLDAELIVLTDASTASADGTPGLEGLPRLARAFLHAGGRSILVSHWAVSADSTLKLVSRMLRERARGAGNAEALRRAMLALMNGEDRPAYMHPMYWAPFVVVGEGARGASAGPATLKSPATRR